MQRSGKASGPAPSMRACCQPPPLRRQKHRDVEMRLSILALLLEDCQLLDNLATARWAATFAWVRKWVIESQAHTGQSLPCSSACSMKTQKIWSLEKGSEGSKPHRRHPKDFTDRPMKVFNTVCLFAPAWCFWDWTFPKQLGEHGQWRTSTPSEPQLPGASDQLAAGGCWLCPQPWSHQPPGTSPPGSDAGWLFPAFPSKRPSPSPSHPTTLWWPRKREGPKRPRNLQRRPSWATLQWAERVQDTSYYRNATNRNKLISTQHPDSDAAGAPKHSVKSTQPFARLSPTRHDS